MTLVAKGNGPARENRSASKVVRASRTEHKATASPDRLGAALQASLGRRGGDGS